MRAPDDRGPDADNVGAGNGLLAGGTETTVTDTADSGAMDAHVAALPVAGVPIFTAPPNPRFDPAVTDYKDSRSKEFWLPSSWQKVTCDLANGYIDRYRHGHAVGMLCGVDLDVFDVDVKNGADVDTERAAIEAAGIVIVAEVRTASGGAHFYVMSTGIASSAKPVNGVDYRGGLVDGSGRGFVYLPGTVRSPLKYPDGGTYSWVRRPDLSRLDGVDRADQQTRILGYLRSKGMDPKHDTDDGVVRGGATPRPPAPPEDVTGSEVEVPGWLRELVADHGPEWTTATGATSKDRSERFYRLVGACRAARLTRAQAVDLLTPWCEAVDKYVGRVDDEVDRAWGKVDPPAPLGATDVADPDRWIVKKDGLLVADLADDIVKDAPLMRDLGDAIWAYTRGVWKPDRAGWVRRSVTTRLGNKARPAHTQAVEHYLLGTVPVLECRPVPEYLNVRNGLLDWRTGTLHPHDPAVLSTVQLGTTWDPDATCEVVDAWLAEVLPADLLEPTDDGPGFIWEVIGYLCFSGNPLHKAVLLLGTGRNGKGTFLRLLTALLGAENVSSVDLHSLVTNKFRVAELFGKVANVAGDLDGAWLESTATFKAITGEDRVTAERKYGHPFDFTPFAVPVYSANKVFGTPDTSAGYMSRWVVVPLPNTFLGQEDRGLDDRLQAPDQIAGMLVKAVAGLKAVMARGNFTQPASVTEAFARFADESDPVRTFVRDATRLDPDGWVSRAEIWKVYRAWVADSGIRSPLSRSALYSRLETVGCVPAGRNGTRGFSGRTLTVRVVELDDRGNTTLEPTGPQVADGDGEPRGPEPAAAPDPAPETQQVAEVAATTHSAYLPREDDPEVDVGGSSRECEGSATSATEPPPPPVDGDPWAWDEDTLGAWIADEAAHLTDGGAQ